MSKSKCGVYKDDNGFCLHCKSQLEQYKKMQEDEEMSDLVNWLLAFLMSAAMFLAVKIILYVVGVDL
jgi:hypothetical protein